MAINQLLSTLPTMLC